MHLFNLIKNKQLGEMYMSIAIRSLARSMIHIFIPIYLLNIGYSLFTVLFFYALMNFCHAAFVLASGKVASRFGFKHTILLSLPFSMLFYFMLYTLPQFNWSLGLIAVIFGFQNSLYWTAYHLNLVKFSDKKMRGSEVGFARVISQIVQVAGPFLGGLLLTVAGFKPLFLYVAALFFASAIPLFMSKEVHDPIHFRVHKLLKGQSVKDGITYIGCGIETGMQMVVWPVFIYFTVLKNFATLGFVSSLTILFSIIASLVVGRYTDVNRRILLRIGSVLNAVVWIFRTIVKTTLQVFMIDSVAGIVQTMIHVPFNAISYDKADRLGLIKAIVFREITIQVGRVILFVTLAYFANLIYGFVFGGASLLYFFF
ncbi:MAG: MFS transporter [Nanoarchaeota archaeon]|nr:MFS transporter [Nanoarchaeota archaeon]